MIDNLTYIWTNRISERCGVIKGANSCFQPWCNSDYAINRQKLSVA